MNTPAATSAAAVAATPASSECWHCRAPLPRHDVVHARIAGQLRPMCCHGCRAAAEWIEALGLGDYYQLRTAPAPGPAPAGAPQLDPQLARHVIRELDRERHEAMLLVEGVRCTACVWLIERALGSAPGVVKVQVNAASRRARIVWRHADITLPQILSLLTRTGYRGLPLHAKALDDARRREFRDALKRLLVAGFGAMQAMMYAAVLYFGADALLDTSTQELFRWLGFVAAMPVVFYSARPFFSGAARALAARQLSMDVPVALAIALIYAASLIEALRGGGHVYFESVSMFVFFLLAGRYVEMRARHRSGELTDALARLTPMCADRLRADGSIERIGIHELRAGDLALVAEGGIVPADGVLLSEQCRVDEALLSGESTPIQRRGGERLTGGSLLIEGPARLRIDRVGADTTLAGIAALVERAQAERPQLARAGDRAAALFVARVLTLTVLTAAAWTLVDPARAFEAALAVLVVSCPCAFALAVPAAITRAIAVLARHGVLVVKPDAIQALAETSQVVFDKTGTLTEPELTVSDLQTFGGTTPDTALAMAAALAQGSRHPVARAMVRAFASTPTCTPTLDAATHVTATAGLGISGELAGRRLRLGRPDFAQTPGTTPIDDDQVLLADTKGPIAAFRLSECLRADARAAVDALRAQGLTIALASGDAAAKVAQVATRLDIDQWRARQLPAEKLAWLTELRAKGARVMAVGDGINDAPVLAGADVAVAMMSSAELAQASSDIVLSGNRLEALATARATAIQTMTILRQNHRWALGYNLTAVPLAALGFVPPWLAALGMSLSSLCVILNALRIGRQAKAMRRPARQLSGAPTPMPMPSQRASLVP